MVDQEANIPQPAEGVQRTSSPEAAKEPEASSGMPEAMPPAELSPGDERTWGVLAHLSVLVNLATGFGGPIAAFVLYLLYRNRSRFIAYHALQSLIVQLVGWYGAGALIGILWAIVGVSSVLIIGVVLIPLALVLTLVLALLPLGTLVYGCYGAYQVSQDKDFRYWLVGDWVRGTLTGR